MEKYNTTWSYHDTREMQRTSMNGRLPLLRLRLMSLLLLLCLCGSSAALGVWPVQDDASANSSRMQGGHPRTSAPSQPASPENSPRVAVAAAAPPNGPPRRANDEDFYGDDGNRPSHPPRRPHLKASSPPPSSPQSKLRGQRRGLLDCQIVTTHGTFISIQPQKVV